MTQSQFDTIQSGLGQYALEKRFVVRQGKIPINPSSTEKGAKSNDPNTWGTFDQAIQALDENEGLDGIGVMLGNGLCGIDIDHCIDNGERFDEAREVIMDMDSYTELSMSGTGIHILFEGMLPEGRRRNSFIEMYSEGRYFALTGNLYEPK